MKHGSLIILLSQLIFSTSAFAEELDIIFSPASPKIHLESTTQVGDVTVYDHSEFSVTIKNTHYKSINIQGVNFISIGDIQTSGLGNIINYWPWKDSRTLKPGETISFSKVWGFTVDTPNSEMTYHFEVNYNIVGRKETKQFVKELVLRPDA
ncbi:MAG: hypothetical protein OQK32_08040 [Gammaproteobacteria bacterium]|nr:hypothetical protein [Gammaproteobacteria bacterium]MCW8923854.1 hypothetical protein [Gammaproteobacteria bacterium]